MKETFIRFALECEVLKFGQFTLKSGRQSPYFFNAGLFHHGAALRQVGQCYAELLLAQNVNCQQLFGPAYKGIPLVTATAIALAERGVDVSVTFNRKEVKDHGEGGCLIGAPLISDTVIIDDVITSGKAFREAQQLIHSQNVRVSAVVIALDRCERGLGSQSTLDEIRSEGIQVCSIITIFDLIDYLKTHNQTDKADILQEYVAVL